MLDPDYFDAELLANVVNELNTGGVAAVVLAVAAEMSTLRSAFVSLLGVVEARSPATREIVLQDLHEVLSKEMHPPAGIDRNPARVEALNYLIDALEMKLRPDQT